MINWGKTSRLGSTATIYWPQVAAAEVLDLSSADVRGAGC